MSSLYQIDFSLAGERLSPPSKRQPKLLAWLKVLVFPLQWIANLMRLNYLDGIAALEYSSLTVYTFGDLVKYNGKVYHYSNLTDESGKVPTDSSYWELVLPSNLGIRKRINFNSQTIVLEYILNERFNPTGVPAIYINNTDNDIPFNHIYKSEEDYPPLYLYSSVPDDPPELNPVFFIYKKSEYIPEYDFEVMVPESLLPAVTTEEKEKFAQRVDAEVLKYRIAGVNHIVKFYP